MNYQQTARELDALDERSEEISERLDEIEEELEYAKPVIISTRVPCSSIALIA